MFYAKERSTEKIVWAAKASLYGDFRCPTCKAEVFLKRGEVYRDHFAHMPGQGKPECDDYHPPEDLRRQWQTAAPAKDLPVEGMALSIELEPEADTRGPRKWGLRLSLPKSHDGRGEIRIDLGGGDVRKVALSTLSLEARSYRVDPAAPDFGAIWVSPEVRPLYRAAVEHRITGLVPRFASVFGATPQKLKLQANVLRWGDSYYFVWRNDLQLAFPESLSHHALAENLGWRCSLVTLPDKADPAIAAWLARMCDLQIARAKREWALLYPAPYAVDDDGSLQVPSASPVLLAIKPIENDDGAKITCQAGQSSALQLKGSNENFIHIAFTDQVPPRRVHLAWDGLPLNSLAPQPYPEVLEPSVALEFETGSAKAHALLHRATSAVLLNQVRRGVSRLSAIHAPAMITGQLRLRRPGQFDWEQQRLTFSETAKRDASLSVEQLAHINAALQDQQREVVLDFGAFGSFSAHALQVSQTRPSAFRISRDLRARIEWLCKASGMFVDRRCRPLNRLDDAALVRHLSSFQPPLWLVSHRRVLDNELRNRAALS